MSTTQSWDHYQDEGQLAVDIIDIGSHIVAISTMAGAHTDSIEVTVHNDLLTIRGKRMMPSVSKGDYVEQVYHRECFWGTFSRTIVLPVDVQGDMSTAEYDNGILVIRIPKKKEQKPVKVVVVNE